MRSRVFFILSIIPILFFGQYTPPLDNEMVTFEDLKYMIDNEGFLERNSFDYTSTRCATKEEIIDAVRVKFTNIETLLYTQLVRRDSLFIDSNIPPQAPIIVRAINVTRGSMTVSYSPHDGSGDDDGTVVDHSFYAEDLYSIPNGDWLFDFENSSIGMTGFYFVKNLVENHVYKLTVKAIDNLGASSDPSLGDNFYTTRIDEVVSDNASGTINICEEDGIILTAATGGSWEWSTGETTKSITVHPTQNEGEVTYWVDQDLGIVTDRDTIIVRAFDCD